MVLRSHKHRQTRAVDQGKRHRMQIKDIDGQRAVALEKSEHIATSIFLTTGSACIEFDRGIFLHAIAKEFDLIERPDLAMT